MRCAIKAYTHHNSEAYIGDMISKLNLIFASTVITIFINIDLSKQNKTHIIMYIVNT